MHLGQFAQTEAMGTIAEQGLAIYVESGTANVQAFHFCSPHAGPHAFDNKVAFEFGDGADDDDHGTAQRPAGVEILPEAEELNVQMVEFVQHFQKMPGAASQPIAGPDQHTVEAATAGVGQHLVKTRAACPGPSNAVGVALDNLIAALLGHAFQIMDLSFRVLIQSRNPQVEGGAFQARTLMPWAAKRSRTRLCSPQREFTTSGSGLAENNSLSICSCSLW